MSNPLYHTTRWRKRRAHQLAEEPLCRMCGEMGRAEVATVADHVVPHRGDEVSFWCGELASLCKHCHDSHKKVQEHRGILPGARVDGTPVDPGHFWNK